jgi:hypothetical protein
VGLTEALGLGVGVGGVGVGEGETDGLGLGLGVGVGLGLGLGLPQPSTMTGTAKSNTEARNFFMAKAIDPKTGRRIRVPTGPLSGRGVSWDKKAKAWRARIFRTFLGYYDKKEDAIKARRRAEERIAEGLPPTG